MAEVVTLDALGSNDPGYADNSALHQGRLDPTATAGTSGLESDAVFDELAKQRQLTERHRNQINGAKAEVQRWRERVAQQDETLKVNEQKVHDLELKMAQMEGRLQAQAPSAPTTQTFNLKPDAHPADHAPGAAPAVKSEPPEKWKAGMRKTLQYNASDEDLQEIWDEQVAAMQPHGALTQQDLDAYWAKRTEEQHRQAQMGAIISSTHPELSDAQNPVTARTMQIYEQLEKDPAMKQLYDNGMEVVDPNSQRAFSAGLVMFAATQAKAELAASRGATLQRNGLPTAGIPGAPAATPPAPPDPRHVISKGLADLLTHPDLVREADRAGIGTDPLSIWRHIETGLPESTRQSWAQEAGLYTTR